ncbi:MAG: chorismate dehydratase [Candidatus Krumholzibacteriia bacterium]|jgi:chorismate dehydratase
MNFRVAAVSFLNTIPLIEYLADPSDVNCTVTTALPSRLAGMLNEGSVDVALVPVVELFRGCGAGMVEGSGIACCGRVDSVKMFHRGPVSDLKRIQVDRGSRSSVALLNVLMKEITGAVPPFQEVKPDANRKLEWGEGILVIGDRCFEFERQWLAGGDESLQEMDLGLAWYELTKLPFVFAVWAISGDFMCENSAEDVARVVIQLNRAREKGEDSLSQLAEREASRGRLGHKGEATAEAVAYYFKKSLRFQLGELEMRGLARFHELCIKHGVVPSGPSPMILRG